MEGQLPEIRVAGDHDPLLVLRGREKNAVSSAQASLLWPTERRAPACVVPALLVQGYSHWPEGASDDCSSDRLRRRARIG